PVSRISRPRILGHMGHGETGATGQRGNKGVRCPLMSVTTGSIRGAIWRVLFNLKGQRMHTQTWAKVNAPVDTGVCGLVSALSMFPSLETIESCECSVGECAWICFRYGAYWEHP